MRPYGPVRNGRVESTPMPTPTHIAGTVPNADPSQPANSDASGMTPHTTNRMEAFMRPSRRRGHSRCRAVT